MHVLTWLYIYDTRGGGGVNSGDGGGGGYRENRGQVGDWSVGWGRLTSRGVFEWAAGSKRRDCRSNMQ